MKRIFLSFAIFLIISISVFSQEQKRKTWTSNLGLGFTLPISTLNIDEDWADEVKQIGYGIEGTYFGYHKNGFTLKIDLSLGLATSKDIEIQNRSTNLGLFSKASLGAGYTFLRTQKFALGTNWNARIRLFVFFARG